MTYISKETHTTIGITLDHDHCYTNPCLNVVHAIDEDCNNEIRLEVKGQPAIMLHPNDALQLIVALVDLVPRHPR